MIAVLGASGFIGQNIQSILNKNYKEEFKDALMIYFNRTNNILEEFNKISFYEFIKNQKLIDKIDTLIIVAGNSNRNIDTNNFYEFIKKDTNYIFEMKDKIKCNVIFLSSAAVYDGNYGCIKEDQNIRPDSLYGICKYNSEMTIKYIMKNIKNKKLIIYRLMYGYGKFERDNRLMSLIGSCIKENKVLTVNGYNNYFNPLSAEFISKTIIESAKNIDIFPREEVINLSSLKNIKLIEVLDILNSKKNLKYKLAGEEPIINYYPSINKLKYYLKKLDLQEEDTEKILINYFS
ncbi:MULTISPECIES: NAD-dependent epimerase/dehydratase family protein [Clostridium]|uniref:Epimerase n=3 Tax=Clostridium TaxID=1485 RepID=A0A7X5PDA7_CLOSG|nr:MULTISPECIES: NAD-dependent epimerase/dehydratase family protein [Clostridium]AJD30528.1 rmlD substrate binding domain protein [Clostridium botulinum Prevot_594]AVP63468.1 epimerase [Clostridium botulinum]AKC61786.1 NAD-dependent epimerase/dehydratase [Clostridium sporogenes]AKJ89095.1 epimerase [Clostridium sporogenes]EHN16618.1 NAD-dependent epimerase/dehydratase [Clostridium sporogenes PA 3679]